EKVRQDKRKGLQSRLDFGDSPKRVRRIRSDSLGSMDGTPPARYRHKREKDGGRSVFNRLSHRKKSALERLSDTYSPSTTKTGPSNATSRDYSRDKNRPNSGDRSSDRNHSRIRDRLRGVEESYGDTYPSRRTRHRDRSRGDWLKVFTPYIYNI
ncbi:hypothetical protein Tco_0905209, partial [Tanacetum coccineum]